MNSKSKMNSQNIVLLLFFQRKNYYNESQSLYYIGKCNKLGNDNYIQINSLNKNSYSSSSSNLDNMIISEAYSENSFCYQSSLTVSSNFNNLNRALCYESFCSSKSLTIKINDIYIVCPKQGGKINVIGYNGYFLCPDYYLICSGKILCNDMFDCIIKKSEIKEESYIYDYKIKTSQNIENADIEYADNGTNYELSEDGKCPLNCKICLENKKCIKCREDFEFVGMKNEKEIICIQKDELKTGYYLNDSVYYKCMDFCEKCENDTSCDKCIDNYDYLNNSCLRIIQNYESYNSNRECQKCNENYALDGEKRDECIKKEEFNEFYYT